MLPCVKIPAEVDGFQYPWSWAIVKVGCETSCNSKIVSEKTVVFENFEAFWEIVKQQVFLWNFELCAENKDQELQN